MPTATASILIQGGGVAINGQISRTADSVPSIEVALPAGKAGTLTTRTNDTVGTVTLGASHGIVDADLVDLYWDGGMRYGVVVGTVAGNDVPITGGAGDVLPADETAVVMTKQVAIGATIDGDNCTFLAAMFEVAAGAVGKAHFEGEDAANATILETDLVGNEPQILFVSASGTANPATGNVITELRASNGSATVAGTLKVVVAIDLTV